MEKLGKDLAALLPPLKKGKPGKILHWILTEITSELKMLKNQDERITAGILSGSLKNYSRDRNPQSFLPFAEYFLEKLYKNRCDGNVRKLAQLNQNLTEIMRQYYHDRHQTERILLEIPKDLKRRLKEQPGSMKDFIVQALEEKLTQSKPGEKAGSTKKKR